jgi:hypothetical protein
LYRLKPELAGAEPQRTNLYAFSLNNPLRYYDADGRDPIEWLESGAAWFGEHIFVPTVEMFFGGSVGNTPESLDDTLHDRQSYLEQAGQVAVGMLGGKLIGGAAGWASKKVSAATESTIRGLAARQAANWQKALAGAAERMAASRAKYGDAGLVGMAITRKRALSRIDGLVPQVEQHLAKLAAEPGGLAASHWRKELNAFIGEIERLIPHVGRATGAEWTKKVQLWRNELLRLQGY